MKYLIAYIGITVLYTLRVIIDNLTNKLLVMWLQFHSGL